ncbi:DNA polymerase III, subunits gamma and tau [Candidatus Sulfopaludibacter sp. SbA4]|nr:DNA polymerase III, subunits gamma and tau [Candidatus Sulfopaludibacter sp. SbA4]
MYQVIARKYRPQTFQDVVNQEHVKTTLENAIAQKRIAHGYIFSGQRGTGKTTVARIMARCLNCVNGPTTQPCGVCANCLEAASGGGLNVIEIDAASNRGINEMRELNQSVRQRPASARYKVFIVDEAHQITTDAFNALLKTIEEPPEWVIFILCTTEQHKIPATIASRCQHFSFRSVDFEELIARMAWICKEEGIDADQEALAVLAQAGEGSVRDSLSALDQAIACCGAKLNAAEVRALLGAFSLESLDTVTQALAGNDSRRMLEVVDELERNGQNLQHFSRELSRYFRNLLVTRIAGAEGPLAARLVAASAQQRAKLAGIAAQFSEEDLTRYLQLSLDLFKDLQSSLQPRFHLEIGLVRLVQAGRLLPIEQALAQMQGGPGPAPAPRSGPQGTQAPTPPAPKAGPSPFELDRARKAAARPAEEAVSTQKEDRPGGLSHGLSHSDDWRPKLHAALMELGMPYTADAVENSRVVEVNGELQILTSKAYKLALREDDLRKAVSQVSPRMLRIKVIIGEVEQASAPLAPPPANNEDEATRRALANPEVQRFQEVFDGKIYKVRNLKES